MDPVATKHITISYNIIFDGTRDTDNLIRCLDSVYGALYREGDEAVLVDTGQTDSETAAAIVAKLSKFPGARIVPHRCTVDVTPYLEKWLPEHKEKWVKMRNGSPYVVLDFSEPREVARLASKNAVCFWIDSDDVITENRVGAARQLVDRYMDDTKPDCHETIFLSYQYSFGDDGQCNTELKRERFFFKDHVKWVGRCHEVPIYTIDDPRRNGYFMDCGVSIAHRTDGRPGVVSDVRNYIIQRRAREELNDCDPRTTFYFGNAARGLCRFGEAIELYKAFIPISGSIDDTYAAYYHLAGLYLTPSLQRPFDAMDCFQQCVNIDPARPRGWFGLASTNAALQRWERVIHYVKIGEALPVNRGEAHSVDPFHETFLPYYVAAQALCELHRYEEAGRYISRALAVRPDFAPARQMYDAMANEAAGNRFTDALQLIGMNLKNGGLNAVRVVQSILAEAHAAPPQLEEAGIGRLEGPDPRSSALPEIVFFCTSTAEPWGPSAAQHGIGGSEKMVILLAAALQCTEKCRVTVYAHVAPDERGVDAKTGVLWRHFSELDRKRPVDVFVSWRNPNALCVMPPPARLRILWNHDVQNPQTYTKKLLACTDYVQVQSEFHADAIRSVVPPDQLWVANNGIVKPTDRNIERDPKLILYGSSPDRGLLTAARIVEEAQKTDPEIKLVVLYGFTPYARKAFASYAFRYCPDVGHETFMDDYERDVFAQLDKINARVLHRVSFDMVETIMQGCGAWLYPTRFHEISCMSAMESMANGCVPVCPDFAALKETVPTYRLPCLPKQGPVSSDYIKNAAQALRDVTDITNDSSLRTYYADYAISKYNIDKLAETWLAKLGLIPVAAVSLAPEQGAERATISP